MGDDIISLTQNNYDKYDNLYMQTVSFGIINKWAKVVERSTAVTIKINEKWESKKLNGSAVNLDNYCKSSAKSGHY